MSEVIQKDSPTARLAAWGWGAARPVAVGLIAGAAAVAAMSWSTPPPLVASAVPAAGHRSVLGFTVQPPGMGAGADAKLRSALARRMDSFSVVNLPARAAFERWARQAGVNLSVVWSSRTGWGVDAKGFVSLDVHDVPAGRVLKLLIAATGPSTPMVAFARGNVMCVGPAESGGMYDADRIVTRFYDVRPLVVESVLQTWGPDLGSEARRYEEIASDNLINMLIKSVSYDVRTEGANPNCSIFHWAGWLIVRNTPEAQEQVATLLDTLAKARK